MLRVKGILFDLGNTLLDFGRVDILRLFKDGARQAYSYLKELDQPLPPFRKFHQRQLWAIRWRYLVTKLTGREFNSLDVLRGASQSMGQSLTHDEVLELSWRWYRPLADCAEVEEGLSDLLEGFRREGLRLGMVSNTFVPGEVLDRHLRQVGLLEHFETRIYSCDVSYRKPDKRIFEIALERVGVAAGEAIFVGDSLKADVVGAERAGMISVLKDPSGKKRRRGVKPAHRITCMAELPAVVAAYNGSSARGEGGIDA